jgi:hypothetical protein
MVIDEVLNPLTVEAFVKEFAGVRWWRQTGTPRRFDALLSWASLNDALE